MGPIPFIFQQARTDLEYWVIPATCAPLLVNLSQDRGSGSGGVLCQDTNVIGDHFSLARHYKGDRCNCASFRIMIKIIIRRFQDWRHMQGMSQKFRNKLEVCVKGCEGNYTFIICKALLRMQFIHSCRLLYLSLPVLPLATPVHFRSISHCNRGGACNACNAV